MSWHLNIRLSICLSSDGTGALSSRVTRVFILDEPNAVSSSDDDDHMQDHK